MAKAYTFMHTQPVCDVNAEHGLAIADARIPGVGSWAYLCERCFNQCGCQLGTGKGQVLVPCQKGVGSTEPPTEEGKDE